MENCTPEVQMIYGNVLSNTTMVNQTTQRNTKKTKHKKSMHPNKKNDLVQMQHKKTYEKHINSRIWTIPFLELSSSKQTK